MSKTIIILSMIYFLSACQTPFERKLICAQIKKHEIKVVPLCDISFKFNRCRCRNFDMNNWEAVGGFKDHELQHCEGIAGFFLNPDIATEIRPNVKALANIKGNLCQE